MGDAKVVALRPKPPVPPLAGEAEPRVFLEIAEANRKNALTSAATHARLSRLEQEIGQADDQLAYLREQLEAVRRQISALEYRDFKPLMTTLLYGVANICIGVPELALNKSGIDQLRVDELHAWGIAGFISIVSLVLAKYAGKTLAQRPPLRSWPTWILLLGRNAVLFAALWNVALLRSADTPGGGATTFLFLQLAGYAAAVGLAFYQTNPSHRCEQLVAREARFDRRVQRAWSQRGKLVGDFNGLAAATRLRMDAQIHMTQRRLYGYRESNMLCRADAPPEFMRWAITRDAFDIIALPAPIGAPPGGADVRDPHAQETTR